MKKPGFCIIAAWLAVLVSIGLPGIVAAQHFQCTPTETSHSILIDNAVINGFPLEPGDEIAVVLNSGYCAGFSTYLGGPTGVSAWGDDPNTPEVEGFLPGESMSFRFYRQRTDTEFAVNLWDVNGPTEWAPDAITSVSYAWSPDYEMGTGQGVPVIDVIDFGTIGDRGEDEYWYLYGGLMNIGNAPLIVFDAEAQNGSVESHQFQSPCALPRDHVYEFSVRCRGNNPIEDIFVVQTSEGPVFFDVRAEVFPDGRCQYYDEPPATCENFSLLIEDYELNGTPPMPGDEIVVYGETNNYMAGHGFLDDSYHWGDPIGISVWGDDPNTPEIDGLLPGEPMWIEISRPRMNWWNITTIAIWQGFDGTYSTDGDGQATCVGELLNILGEASATSEPISYPSTKVGLSRCQYQHIENTSQDGWICVEPVEADPESDFRAEFWSFTGSLPPGATAVTVHRYTPQNAGPHTGSTSHKWIDSNGNGVFIVQSDGVGHEDWYHYLPNTGTNHSIIVDHAWINGWCLEPGDEIGFINLDRDDMVCGNASFEYHFPLGGAVWGDDPTTPEIDGFQTNEQIGVRIYDHSESQEFWALAEVMNGAMEWQPDGITAIQVYNIPIPWDFSVFSDQSIFENEWFGPLQLDDAITGGLPEGWGPGGLGTMLDEVDPDSIDWSFAHISEAPRGLDLIVDINEDRIFTVAVPDSEWVGSQTIRLYAMDQYGQQDSVDLNYEVQQVNDPPSLFNLIELEDGEVIDYQDPTLIWHSAQDVDWTDDTVTYELQWGFVLDWPANPSVNTGTDTSYQFTEDVIIHTYQEWISDSQLDELLPDEVTVYWRVFALDGNQGETLSGPDDYWSFSVHINDPPGAFSLLSPADAETLEFVDPPIYNFSWEESVDPDPDAPDVVYNLYVDLPDFAPYMVEVQGTNADVNFYDDAGMDPWIGYLEFSWWVEAISEGDTVTCDEAFDVTIESTSGVGEELLTGVPTSFRIESIYPNPFNPTTTIVVGLAEAGALKVEVFNMLGQRVANLSSGTRAEGYHKFTFDGAGLSSGIYFVHAVVPAKMDEIRRMILIR